MKRAIVSLVLILLLAGFVVADEGKGEREGEAELGGLPPLESS